MTKVYVYGACSTCRRALKFLGEVGASFERIEIVETPPTLTELKRMLTYLRARGRDLRHLFNTSGERYRSLKIGDRLRAGMGEAEALALLAHDGKLIKRPFLMTPTDGMVGFDENAWRTFIDT